ncbi:MAG: hypothetical protein JWM02_447, partial [Frankiales bacterium]|nr:hypothetical protein [Frankiales bacterium]
MNKTKDRDFPMTDDFDRELQELHDQYAHAVNTAVAADREELVEELSREYREHARRLVSGR